MKKNRVDQEGQLGLPQQVNECYTYKGNFSILLGKPFKASIKQLKFSVNIY
jgi:hypothetical protein